MAVSRTTSIRSGATGPVTDAGFVFGFNDGQLNVTKRRPSGVERSFSTSHLPTSHNRQFSFGTPIPEPSRFFSARQSVRSLKTYNPRPYFRSRRIKKGTIDRPELREKDPRQIWITLIPVFGFLVGCAAIALLSWNGYRSVSNHKYCKVFVDDFSNGFNSTIWTKHVETGGYG